MNIQNEPEEKLAEENQTVNEPQLIEQPIVEGTAEAVATEA